MTVAVIGHGPASLAAAWAARGLGHEVVLYGPGEPSKLRGPILLQHPIPGMTVDHPDGYIRQHVIGGTILGYREKLYHDINININGDILEEGYHAWRMEATYEKLWAEFDQDMIKSKFTTRELFNLEESEQFELIINTAPRQDFCLTPYDRGHQFTSQPVDLTWETQIENQEDNSIYFNADPATPWVRSSSVFGSIVTEWPAELGLPEAHRIYKPISTNCNCWPHIFKTGRFGAWKNETWVDTAYYDTRKALLR